MKMTKHTPGPWKIWIMRWPNGQLNGPPSIYAPNAPDGGRHVCEVFDNGQLDANARLIAAAPAMLAALRDIETIGGAGVIERRETGKPTWHALDAIKDAARAAIARAEGAEQELGSVEREWFRREKLGRESIARAEGGR